MSSVFPRGGYPGLGEFGDFIETFSTNLSPCGGEMLGVRFVIGLGKFRTAGDYLRRKKVETFTRMFLQVKSIVFRSGK